MFDSDVKADVSHTHQKGNVKRASQVAQWQRIHLPVQEVQETRVQSLGWEDPLEEMATHSSILAWSIHGQRSLVGYSPWDHTDSDMAGAT